MVDDLTLQGVTEPYRMLTARAEYRLRLRADNAATRLTPKAIVVGCASPERVRHFRFYERERQKVDGILEARYSAAKLNSAGIPVRDDGVLRSLADWLRFPELDRDGLCRVAVEMNQCSAPVVEEAIQDHRYAPYVTRQHHEILRLRSDEAVRLPGHLDYGAIAGLSNEMIERLNSARPTTLGAASRIRGITPAALAAILVHARRKAA
jgi:tRNA uridine 5-carboxymethylaminomethyl modification enzyme